MKSVVDAIAADSDEKVSADGPVFVGACNATMVVDYVGVYSSRMHPLRYVGRPIEYEPVEELGSVSVAVRGESAGRIRVVGVETRLGKLEKAWVKGLARQFEGFAEDFATQLPIQHIHVYETVGSKDQVRVDQYLGLKPNSTQTVCSPSICPVSRLYIIEMLLLVGRLGKMS